MNIEISLLDSTLKAENMQDSHMTEVIRGFFTTLNGVSTNENKKISVPSFNSGTTKEIETTKIQIGPEEIIPKPTNGEGWIKEVIKLNSERTLNTPIGELMQKQEDHWVTGIKVEDDGSKRYRAYYWCDCGSKGKRYVKKEAGTLNCRDCNQEIYLEPATPDFQDNGLPERDKFGNFFIAREMVETD